MSRTTGTGNSVLMGQDNPDKTIRAAGTGQSGQCTWDRTAGTVQIEQDGQNISVMTGHGDRRVRTGKPGQDNRNRTQGEDGRVRGQDGQNMTIGIYIIGRIAMTRQPGQESWDRRNGTGHLRQNSRDRSGRTGWLENGQNSCDRITRTGSPLQDSQDRTARSGQPKHLGLTTRKRQPG